MTNKRQVEILRSRLRFDPCAECKDPECRGAHHHALTPEKPPTASRLAPLRRFACLGRGGYYRIDMNAKQRYDAKRPLVSFRLAKGDLERFDAWRGELARSQGAAQLAEGLHNGHEPDMQPAPGQQLLPCELELVAELGGPSPELGTILGVAFKALRGEEVPRGSARYLRARQVTT